MYPDKKVKATALAFFRSRLPPYKIDIFPKHAIMRIDLLIDREGFQLKPRFLSIFILLILGIGGSLLYHFSLPKPITQTEYFQLASTNWSLYSVSQKEQAFHDATWKTMQWSVRNGENVTGMLTYQQNQLKNGDIYYFIKYIPQVDRKEEVSIRLPIKLTSFQYRSVTYPNLNRLRSIWYGGGVENQSVIGKTLSVTTSSASNLPVSPLYVDAPNSSCFFSYVDVLENQNRGVKKDHEDLSRAIEVTKEGVVLHLPSVKNTSVEQWGIISKKPLVDWKNPQVLDALQVGDFGQIRKWSLDGYYEITPSSYDPSSPTSFWRNPGNAIGIKFLGLAGKSRFLDDFTLVSLNTAVSTQNGQGYWTSTPRSTWLYKDYGIDEGFYDTRFCTDTALFLLKAYKEGFHDPLFLQAAKKYSDFYKGYAATHHFKTAHGGLLVWDYGNEKQPHAATHTSLNHLANEMNFLYELYKVTKDEKDHQLAEQIKVAVKDTTPFWKKENGDLCYSRHKDGTFGGTDYPLVTLKDLRYSQSLFKEVDGAPDPDFSHLIQMKEAYLRKMNLPLY